jgi:hypothetical protein
MRLVLGSLPIGVVLKPLFCDQSWFGVLQLDQGIRDVEIGRRVLAYKEFSENWHDRLESSQDAPPSTSEWNGYLDLLESPGWFLEDETEGVSHHVDCPVFFRGGDLTCRPWELSHPEL